MHMVLDGENWRSAIERHVAGVDKAWVHTVLEQYQAQGYTYLRDGGDKWGVCAYARQVAGQYGITYRIPFAPISKAGHYGGFIGVQYADLKEYAQLVRKHRTSGADFIKIMISGLMDFNYYGLLSEQGLPADEIKELIHIAHEEGMAVSVHGNGGKNVMAAAEAGVDSVEHGAYLTEEALHAMKEAGTVWVPTLSTIGNLRGKGRFEEAAVEAILESALENVSRFATMGGLIAPGTDAGAWEVPHAIETEYTLLNQVLNNKSEEILKKGIQQIQCKF